MSTYYTVELQCSHCDKPFSARLADSINVARHAAGRQQVLDRTFHRVTCEHCGGSALVDKPLMYVDFDRGLFIQVEPEVIRPKYAEHEGLIGQVHERVFGAEKTPPFVREMGERAAPRLVFGYEELREKVVARDHAIDDRVLEILKLNLVASWPELLRGGFEVAYLDDVTTEGELELLLLYQQANPITPPPGLPRRITLPRQTYDEVAAALPEIRRSYQELFHCAWVNMLRYRVGDDHQSASTP